VDVLCIILYLPISIQSSRYTMRFRFMHYTYNAVPIQYTAIPMFMYNFITPINLIIIFGGKTQVKHVHLPISYYLI